MYIPSIYSTQILYTYIVEKYCHLSLYNIIVIYRRRQVYDSYKNNIETIDMQVTNCRQYIIINYCIGT